MFSYENYNHQSANCAAAYREIMEEQRKKIGAGMEEMFARVCPQTCGPSAPLDEEGALQEAFIQLCKQIHQLVNESECDFKNYETAAKQWDNKKYQLEKELEGKKANAAILPPGQIEQAQKSLDDHMAAILPLKWMIDAREVLRNPNSIQNRKS